MCFSSHVFFPQLFSLSFLGSRRLLASGGGEPGYEGINGGREEFFRISGGRKASGVGSDAGNVGIGGWTLGLGTVLGPRDV